MSSLEARLRGAADVILAWRDVLDERVDGAAPPAWAERRGWSPWLGGLGEEALERLEAGGARALASAAAPDDLRALARRALEVTGDPLPAEGPTRARKAGQVDALVARCLALDVRPARVVDVGAGRGALTRALAAALGAPALGLERDPARVRRARAATRRSERARFDAVEVTAHDVAFAPGDLVVGLHACGDLGDTLISAAARDGAHVLLVACCPQKVRAPARAPLSALGGELGLVLPRGLLGLANAPASAPDLPGRAARHAVRALLRARGAEVAPGDEARGVPPRAWRDLEQAAAAALSRRGLDAATGAELAAALEAARTDVGRARRWSLPRRLLGGVLETALALDRGRALEEAGATVEVGPVFPRALSPRDLGVVARARA